MINYIQILSVHIRLFYELYFLRKRHVRKLVKQLNGLLAYDQQLTESQLKRIGLYTSLGFYVNSCLATLRGRKLSQTEIKNTLHLSILTPLLDDLTDVLKLSSTEILEQLNSYTGDNADNMLLPKYLFDQIRDHSNGELFYETFKQALIAQDESLLQLEKPPLTDEQLSRITYEKGSIWTVLFRLMLTTPLEDHEKEAILLFGHITQLTNDMYDVYKDLQNGQQTLFTNASDIVRYEKEYDELTQSMIQSFSSLGYDYKYTRKCLHRLSVITSLGKLCLEQLKSCQAETGGVFKAINYTRSQLVCDMEKWQNRKRYVVLQLRAYDQLRRLFGGRK